MTCEINRRMRRLPYPLALALASSLVLAACGSDTAENDGGEQATVVPADSASGAAASGTRGDTLVLDSTAIRLAGIELVRVDTASGSFLIANGTIGFNEDRAAGVAPRSEGRIVGVRADLGQKVRVGQTLALVASAEVGQMRGEIESARARRDVAKGNFEREKRLFEQQISSEKEMLEAEGDYRVASADYNSALARLGSTGAAQGSGATYALVAPVTGVVVERNARPGQVVGPESNLFTVADLTHLWITADVYENDLTRVRKGATATVTPRALGSEGFPGTVTYAGGVVDSATHTFKVRVEVENEGGKLRPGMYASVRIRTPQVGARRIVVPEEAVQEVDGRKAVFVVGATPGHFIIRQVVVGDPGGDGTVTIRQGLQPGEMVVGKGAFQLKAERLKASLGEDE